jgi:hypothetical protein
MSVHGPGGIARTRADPPFPREGQPIGNTPTHGFVARDVKPVEQGSVPKRTGHFAVKPVELFLLL